ncbi:hypothetical protein RclHR1_08940004 [Rhizophagus clarus]|uniref:Uncharacterized protein n=1 Tax=Rhizophagus clarus TaxID=94130 RepID=A0A2Z6SPE1_9GLOM|nr:hypothetical protein RclHR1_08940004 [Rhizophagus clarus]GES94594.1 hypothetical protein GLOIN_2v1869609 [Rhizophagus clarus]
MEKKIVQRQPYSYRYSKQGTESMSLSDRFTLIKMQKHISTQNPSLNRFIHRKSNKGTLTTVKRTRRAFSAAANDAQMSRISEIEGQSVFSRIGAVAQTVSFNQGKTTVNRIPSGKVIMRNQEQNNNQRKKKKPRRTRSKSNILNFKLPVIHEKRGTFSEEIKEKNKIQEGKNITPPNSATKKVEMSAPRKRKIVIDANDLDKELEEYMAAAPHAAASKVNDESEDLIDFEIDFMDIEE